MMLRMSTGAVGFLVVVAYSSGVRASVPPLSTSMGLDRPSMTIEMSWAQREAAMDLAAAQRHHDEKLRADLENTWAQKQNPEPSARGSESGQREPATTNE